MTKEYRIIYPNKVVDFKHSEQAVRNAINKWSIHNGISIYPSRKAHPNTVLGSIPTDIGVVSVSIVELGE